MEYANISDTTSDYFNYKLFKERDKIRIDFDFLRPDEGFTLLIKINSYSNSIWNLPIKQRKNIICFPSVIKARGKKSNINLFTNVFNFIILGMCTYIISKKIKYTELDNVVDYIQLIKPIFYIGLFLFMLPIIVKRLKAPSPPIELELHFVKYNKERQKIKNRIKHLWRKERQND